MSVITQTYPVKGMSCASCSAHVDKALRSVAGVAEVNVSLAMNVAKVTYDNAQCTPIDLQQAVERMGFELVVEEPKPRAVAAKTVVGRQAHKLWTKPPKPKWANCSKPSVWPMALC